ETVPDGICLLQCVLESLTKTFLDKHTPHSSWFLARVVEQYNGSAPAPYSSFLPTLDINTVQNLPAAACMLAILDACKRSLTAYSARLSVLRDSVLQGTARTSHRRTFVTTVLFAPCVTLIVALSTAIVEHQLAKSHEHQPRACLGVFEGVPAKLLQFVVALEDDKKSMDKQLQMALQFWQSKAIRLAFEAPHDLL
ncbi:hypothetical protein As57867_006882, partial [Aphanomyces stellatus]